MTEILLYRGDPEHIGLHEADEALPLSVVLRLSLSAILGRPVSENARMRLRLSPEPADPRLHGTPMVHNLLPDFGYAIVEAAENGRIIYRHPHTVREVVAEPLQKLLHELWPEETAWGYRIDFKGSEQYVVRPAPHVEGVLVSNRRNRPDRYSFAVREVAEKPAPEARLADFGAPALPSSGGVSVLVEPEVFSSLDRVLALSDSVEEGGFLLGTYYRDADREGDYILRISDAPVAQSTGASFLCFTFTGDSFREMKQTLGENKLLGWWHTHLFAATDGFGLSTIDVDLHVSTFRHPWQVAGLINIEPADRRRTLRFYARRGTTLVQCPHWVLGAAGDVPT
jgi:hypothetical protein